MELNNNIEYWISEYELRQFIDKATRYSIDHVYNTTIRLEKIGSSYGYFESYTENARENLDNFCSQLNDKLTKNENWKAIEIDLKDRFLPMINQYLIWYDKHQVEFEKFGNDCPYSFMLSIVESTKHEILKYFPEQYFHKPATSSKPEPPGASETTEPINPYTRYFINGYHWQLFDEWRQELNKPDDFSFIYRVMWEDGFIHSDIGQKAFKTWIESTFSTGDLGKQLKTLSSCDSKAKYTIYQGKINKYQLHSKTLQKRSVNTTKT